MKKYDSNFRVSAEVDLGVIRNNILALKSKLPAGCECVGVVKADAYGHGAVAVAGAINDLVSAFALATVEEALQLRTAVEGKDLYILGYTHPDAYKTVLENGIIPAIFKYEDALTLSGIAKEMGIKARINIKIDTGMGRIGFLANGDSLDLIEKISKLPAIECYGIFTHYSTSDFADKSFTEEQCGVFSEFVRALELRGVHFQKIHSSNSASAIENCCIFGNQVRAGIVMYGLYPSDEVAKNIALKGAMSLKSHIIFIKELEQGCPVSYGKSFVTQKKTRVATVPVGYGDGYPRALSGKGRVLIRGKYAPIIGRVCMDMFMVDVSEIEEACELDEVTLIGNDGDLSISVDDIAAVCDTINYEIICDVGKRVPRKYINP